MAFTTAFLIYPVSLVFATPPPSLFAPRHYLTHITRLIALHTTHAQEPQPANVLNQLSSPLAPLPSNSNPQPPITDINPTTQHPMARDSHTRPTEPEQPPPSETSPPIWWSFSELYQQAPPPLPRYIPSVPAMPEGQMMPDFVLPANRQDARPASSSQSHGPTSSSPSHLQPPRRRRRSEGAGGDRSRQGHVPVPVPELGMGPPVILDGVGGLRRGNVCPVHASLGVFGRGTSMFPGRGVESGNACQLGMMAIFDRGVDGAAPSKVLTMVEGVEPRGGGCTSLMCDGGNRGSCSECLKTFMFGA